ncbi:Uncharacterised protein g9590 [Pycnogonum litorale]
MVKNRNILLFMVFTNFIAHSMQYVQRNETKDPAHRMLINTSDAQPYFDKNVEQNTSFFQRNEIFEYRRGENNILAAYARSGIEVENHSKQGNSTGIINLILTLLISSLIAALLS